MSTLLDLFLEAFPNAVFPPGCWVGDTDEESADDFGEAIRVASRIGARPDLLRRLRDEHPTKGPHRPQHDEGVLHFFTEVEAIAWAHRVAELSEPHFIDAPGCPDLQAGEWWIEAKTVNKSQEARARSEAIVRGLGPNDFYVSRAVATTHPDDGLLNKFEYDFRDSLKKWDRQSRFGKLIVFFDWVGIDFPTSRRGARAQVAAWASSSSKTEGVDIVIAANYDWENPFFSSL